MKKATAILLAVLMTLNLFTFVSAVEYFYDGEYHEYNVIPVYLEVNGNVVENDVPPLIFDSRSLVPARAVFEELGATVTWIPESKKVLIKLGRNTIILTIDDNIAIVNGQEMEMDIPSKIINDRTMIPTRFVGESLGMFIDWRDDDRTIVIEYEKPVDKVDINKIDYVSENGTFSVQVHFDNPITDDNLVIYELEDNPRIVLDIETAFLVEGNVSIDVNNKVIQGIRSAQNNIDPYVTRVVVDLESLTDYSLRLSDDGLTAYIDIINEFYTVTDIKYEGKGIYDDIKIYIDTDDNYIETKTFRLTGEDGDRIVIDVPNAVFGDEVSKILLSENELAHITSIRTGQFQKDVSRIVLDMTGQQQFDVFNSVDGLKILVLDSGLNGLRYDNESFTTPALIFDTPNAGTVFDTDYDPVRKVVKLTLSNYYVDIGKGQLTVNDSYVNFIDVTKSNQFTFIEMHVNDNYSFEFEYKDGKSYLYIKNSYGIEGYDAKTLKDVEVSKKAKNKIVVIDPGHGGKEVGALQLMSAANGRPYEKDLNLQVATYLYDLLREKGVQVFMTRYDDSYVALADRAEFANNINAHLFLSIHHNSVSSATFSDARGCETLYNSYNNHYDKYKIYNNQFASFIQEQLVNNLDTRDRGIKQRDGLAVLNKTKMPAVLTEIGFMSNVNELEKLKNEDYQKLVAESLAIGIINALNKMSN